MKRSRALLTIADLLGAGIRVSVARVAREARVSTWLIYNVPDLRSATERAIAQQQRDGIVPANPVQAPDRTAASLRTDLALAREELRELRQELAKLKARLRAKLGAEAEGSTVGELIPRLRELEEVNSKLLTGMDERDRRIAALVETRDTLEAEVEGKTEALRRLMFSKNVQS
ncbi:hypothetical protein IFR14_16345 [Plantibacter sp. CFBP 8775]|nr:hypothetical protein [Plantibacter sp. CFBP 8775]